MYGRPARVRRHSYIHALHVNIYSWGCDCVLSARLYEQEKARGAVANDLEFVVERVMQQFKRVTGRHITSRVEAHFVQQFMLGLSLERLIRENPGVQDLETILGRKGRRYEGPLYDNAVEGMLLMGCGVGTCHQPPVVLQNIIQAISAAVPHEEDTDLRQWVLPGAGASSNDPGKTPRFPGPDTVLNPLFPVLADCLVCPQAGCSTRTSLHFSRCWRNGAPASHGP